MRSNDVVCWLETVKETNLYAVRAKYICLKFGKHLAALDNLYRLVWCKTAAEDPYRCDI